MSENIDRNAVKQAIPTDPKTGKPYINTVAAVAIAPSGTGSELSEYVAQSVNVIRESGLPNETNAMFTNIEGDLDDVLKTVRDATMVLSSQGFRTEVTLKLDIRPGFSGQIKEKKQLVDEILGQTK
ncbi:thiamine-binding protein [Bifidobacterium sp. ESL0784]|uniref:thiamine-binding protein n=1 Tax=Bifidobacterium sp. ESL0784 TaxID=2983231 RepID=UPI0023F8EB65|nr:thiamine-binding protein [Bifidobacterium sp. ESL0784]MDF7641233.1 thiamine-binding protein [Bifidobacterium sp. ESL0784]